MAAVGTAARRLPLLGLMLVALSIVTNVATKAVNFSLGEYPTAELAVRAVLNVELGLTYAVCAAIAWGLLDTRLTGWLMLLVSFLWQAGSWSRAVTDVGWLWPIFAGFSQVWAICVGVIVFCYPTGRFVKRVDRVIFVIALSIASVRIASTFLLGGDPRDITPTAPNAYALWPDHPLAPVIENLWQLTGLTLIVIVSVRVIARWFASSPPARRVAFVMPVALIAWTIFSLYEILVSVFDLPPIAWMRFITPIAISIIPIAYLAGITHVRNLRSRVSDLVVIARQGVDRLVWEDSLRNTLDDRSLRVFWWDDEAGGYLNSAGKPADPSLRPGVGREGTLLTIDAGDSPLAIINHDITLTENTRLLEAVAAALRLSVDNDRLRSRLERTLHDVRESRRRLVEAGDTARARIERDLHDGSQQLLVSVAIKLRMIGAEVRSDGDPQVAEQLAEVSQQLADALADLRALARGIHPTALTEGGLQTAIRELAARSPIPVDVNVEYMGRASRLVESTIYFAIAECLTNTARHSGATRAAVRVAVRDGVLVFSVTDDGRGIVDADAGTGLRGLGDRVETLGGSVSVRRGLGVLAGHSPADGHRGVGTIVEGVVPFVDASVSAIGVSATEVSTIEVSAIEQEGGPSRVV